MQQRDGARGEVALLVEELLDDQAAGRSNPSASTAQPEPCTPSAAAVKCAVNLSNEPKWSSIAAASSPVGLSPPSGDRFVQKIEWLTWPPRLNARSFSSLLTFARLPVSRASASCVERGVRAGHVGLVVLVVVQLHDRAADVRLERRVVVGEFGEGVVSHCFSLSDAGNNVN